MSQEFNAIMKQLQHLENEYNIIFKIELFTDFTGQVAYVVDTENVKWLDAFHFSDLYNFMRELNEFEKFLKK